MRIDWPRQKDIDAYIKQHDVSEYDARRILQRVALSYAVDSIEDIQDAKVILKELIKGYRV